MELQTGFHYITNYHRRSHPLSIEGGSRIQSCSLSFFEVFQINPPSNIGLSVRKDNRPFALVSAGGSVEFRGMPRSILVGGKTHFSIPRIEWQGFHRQMVAIKGSQKSPSLPGLCGSIDTAVESLQFQLTFHKLPSASVSCLFPFHLRVQTQSIHVEFFVFFESNL